MKTFQFILMLSLPLLFSCQSSNSNESEWFTEETIQIEHGNCDIEPCLELDLKYPIIKESVPNSKSLNEELQRMLGQYLIIDGKAVPKDIQKSIQHFQDAFDDHFANYNGAANLFSAHGEAKVSENPTKIKSILVFMDLYTGGANGMNHFNALNFDSETGKVLHLTDIVENYDAFHATAESQFRKQFKISKEVDFEEVGFFENGIFTLSDKIAFDQTSVIILYDKYEIAAGSMGPIKLEIPFDEVKGYLYSKYRN